MGPLTWDTAWVGSTSRGAGPKSGDDEYTGLSPVLHMVLVVVVSNTRGWFQSALIDWVTTLLSVVWVAGSVDVWASLSGGA